MLNAAVETQLTMRQWIWELRQILLNQTQYFSAKPHKFARNTLCKIKFIRWSLFCLIRSRWSSVHRATLLVFLPFRFWSWNNFYKFFFYHFQFSWSQLKNLFIKLVQKQNRKFVTTVYRIRGYLTTVKLTSTDTGYFFNFLRMSWNLGQHARERWGQC